MKKIFLALLLTANIAFGQVNLNLGLKAYYPFSGNANDVSGNNNNPVFNNATLTADRLGNPNSAYHFDGASTYMKILNSATLNTTDKLSLVAWVKPQGFYPGTCHGNSILMKGDADFLTGNYLLRYDDNAFLNSTQCSVPVEPLHQNFYGGGLVMLAPGYTPYIQANQWYSVIATYDGTTARLYINCQLILSRTQGGATFTNAADLFLGKFNSGSFPYWVNGDLDEIRIYDRALNVDEVNALGACTTTLTCNNWLRTQAVGQSVTVGDLDISNNQVTVEANFNCSSFPINRPDKQQDIVSKHANTTDINYVLRMDLAGVTTTTGQHLTPLPCDNLVLNKTYHVAMVYDGSSLKFYRDGFLMSQIACTGNLILNDWLTTIGDYAVNNPVGTNFLGYINEVRIWNVARTQAQLRTYMDISLPNPTTQTGLLGYYTFDNLLNKQGNAAWNGTLNGGATINNINPNCTFVADSCAVLPSNEGCKGVINLHGDDCVRLPLSQEYYANTGFTWETWFNSNWYENNDNTLRLGQSLIISEDATVCEDIQLGFGWQTLPRNAIGFVVDGSGTCTSRDNNPVFYRPPGGFQPNTWYHVAGVRNYSTNQTQLYFNGLLVDTKTNTGLPFSRNILTRIGTYTVFQDSGFAGKMDEIRIWKTPRSAAEILANYNKCLTGTETGLAAYYRANQSSGLILNNAANATLNGTLDPTVTWNNTINAPLINNCGTPITTTINITLCQGLTYGGHSTSGTYIETFPAANGCDSIRTLNLTVLANIDSVRIKDSLLNCNGFDFDGRAYFNTTGIASWQWYFGDGGTANTQNTSHAYTAAGTYTVKLIVTDSIGCKDSTSINVNALAGVNAEAGADTSICTNGTVSVMLNGTAIGGPYLWSPAVYLNNPNIQNPTATISSTTTFYLNVTGAASCTSIDSVTITINALPLVDARSDTAICRFSSLALTTSSNAATFLWSPAIFVSNPNIASPNYIDNFSHKVYLTGTSAAGCKATDSVDVTVNPLPVVQTIPDTTVCIAQNITLTTTGAQTYSWSPATDLSNPGIANPVFSSNTGRTYTVTGTDVKGCKNTDQVTIIISTPDSLKQPPSFAICQQQSKILDGNNGTRVSYLWSPATYLSNANIINPIANPPQTTVYTLLVTDNTCGFDSTFVTTLTILPAPIVIARKSNDIDCAFKSARLSASGGNQYLWSPATGLSSTVIPNPIATPANTQTYSVLVTDATGCTNTGSVTVFANNTASLARYMPNAFTPNADGNNDCYGLKNWMYIKQLQFYIFNRYGEQVFATANPNTCWDGNYKGKPALAGTYVYVIKAQTDCGTEEQKGSFLLIR